MRFALLSRLPQRRVLLWQELLSAALDGAPVLLGPPHDTPDPALREKVEVLFVADPPPGSFADWPSVRFVQGLWAGVDGLLADPSLPPEVPLARLKDPAFAGVMAEGVATHVLSLHRQLHRYRAQAALRIWQPLAQPQAAERPVGILGMGELGMAAAGVLASLGFPVMGWSRTGRPVPGVEIHTGEDGLAALLARSQILVNLLPLTDSTAGILDRARLARLPQGACLVNFGRGGHLVLPDLIEALDSGRLDHAVLDVFEPEPLPQESPLWEHGGVTILPHVAAVTDPRSAARIVAANAQRFLAGQEPDGLVRRDLGY
ncbi:2-hydroxyacid dehydrogenase [Geminicoccus roseus]|uniref:2-hydroxyacid dehydrogenase n=1 Tax=Geminicoccus roseus TaxID=404900 RepID=UPI0003FD5274|nr:glyoxylate/hydroxypyruvate reductase A [Geminicoccus roseus]